MGRLPLRVRVMHPTLFDVQPTAAVRRTDPIQSVNAARRASERLPSRRARILEALALRDLTDDEICETLGEPVRKWPSVKSARTGLKRDGLVVEVPGVERNGQRVWQTAERARRRYIERIEAVRTSDAL